MGLLAFISPRWANYLVCMVRKAKRFKITEKKVAKLDISKSLEIFPLEDAVQAKELMMIVPASLILAQLAPWYQAQPLIPGETAVVIVKLTGGADAP